MASFTPRVRTTAPSPSTAAPGGPSGSTSASYLQTFVRAAGASIVVLRFSVKEERVEPPAPVGAGARMRHRDRTEVGRQAQRPGREHPGDLEAVVAQGLPRAG